MVHLGVCYYPEHWPHERWALDARLMREAGLGVVRIGEFAWGLLEPEEGRFDFGWLDEAIATLAAEGLRLVIGTPTAAPPAWLTQRHPDVLPVGADGQVRQPGSRRHVCLTSEVFQRASERIVEALAKRYGQHPAVIGWQIDNELGCHDTARCYCLRCADGFQSWLEKRHGTLTALNEAWGTVFWSQLYTDWEQVLPPRGLVYEANPGHWLDWCRYSSANHASYLGQQVEILRQLSPGRFITHNLMGGFDDLDYAELAKPLDFVGWDDYQPAGTTPFDVAFGHDRMRGLLQRSFWVLEQQCGAINWGAYNPTLRPGEVRLKTWQAIAHGADGILYFRWRAGHIGAEQLHSGILPHDGTPGRTYKEIQQTARELADLPELGFAPAPVAILDSEPQHWALKLQPHSQTLREAGPWHYAAPWYAASRRLGLGVDVVPPEADWSSYRVIVAPALYLVDEPLATRLEAYVRGGGKLLIGPRSGFKDAHNRVAPPGPPGYLQGLTGVTVLEFDAPVAETHNEVRFAGGGNFFVDTWMEVLATGPEAEVIARYQYDYYAGEPAVTRRELGAGLVWYLGACGADETLYVSLLSKAAASAGLSTVAVPPDVEVQRRPSSQGELWFVLNHAAEPRSLRLPFASKALNENTSVQGELLLPPRGVLLLRPEA